MSMDQGDSTPPIERDPSQRNSRIAGDLKKILGNKDYTHFWGDTRAREVSIFGPKSIISSQKNEQTLPKMDLSSFYSIFIEVSPGAILEGGTLMTSKFFTHDGLEETLPEFVRGDDGYIYHISNGYYFSTNGSVLRQEIAVNVSPHHVFHDVDSIRQVDFNPGEFKHISEQISPFEYENIEHYISSVQTEDFEED